MPKHIAPKKENAPFTVGNALDPEFLRAHGISGRDVALVEKYTEALVLARAALHNGDAAKARAAYASLTRLTQDAERVRLVVRKVSTPLRVAEA